jgi:hypothetical protein
MAARIVRGTMLQWGAPFKSHRRRNNGCRAMPASYDGHGQGT